MKLYMKEKVFTIVDQFTLWDENEEVRYKVEGEFFSWGKKLHLLTPSGDEVALIHREPLTFLPRFHVYMGGQDVATIRKEFTFFRPVYSIDGLNWDIQGDFFAHDYEVLQNGRVIVSIHKVWLSWGDSYEIEIFDPANEVLALAVVLAIDCVIDQQERN